MKGALVTVLLGLCMTLAASTQDLASKDFDLAKFSGLWYEIAFAAKLQDSALKARKSGAVLVELKQDHLALTASYDHDNQCVKEKSLGLQEDIPGKFKLFKASGTKDIQVVATDYKTYAIMDITFHQGLKGHRVLKLYSRSLENKGDALKRFHELAEQHGFSEKHVHALSWDLNCANLLQAGGAPGS